MGGNLAVQLLALLMTAAAVLVLHEATHSAIARAYRCPTVCLGISPLAVSIVFLDRPTRGYVILQVALPLAVTSVATHAGFFALPPVGWIAQSLLPAESSLQLILCIVLSLLTSYGDLSYMLADLRHPLEGRERLARDIALLGRTGSLVCFTPFGRRYVAAELGLGPRELVEAASTGGARCKVLC